MAFHIYSFPPTFSSLGLIVKYGLTSIHTIHTFLPCASSHPSLIRASPHPPFYLGCACPFPPSRDISLTESSLIIGHPQPLGHVSNFIIIESIAITLVSPRAWFH